MASTRAGALSALALVVGLHAALVVFALTHAPTRRAIAAVTPVLVRFIQPDAPQLTAPPAPPTGAPERPKRVEEPKPIEKPKRVTVPRPVPKPKPDPAPILAATPAPATPPQAEVPPGDRPPPAAVAEAPPPAPVVPPHFNADYLQNPAPAYPAVSRRLGEEGRVVLRVLVDAGGVPAKVELRASSGFQRLDEVALETVRHWKFVPARQGDQAVSAWVLVPISFRLRG